jgi:hypothetical protein
MFFDYFKCKFCLSLFCLIIIEQEKIFLMLAISIFINTKNQHSFNKVRTLFLLTPQKKILI